MVNFSEGIYVKEFKYKDINDVEQTLMLKPLKGKYYKKLWTLSGTLMSNKSIKENANATEEELGEEFFKSLSEENVEKLHEVCLETLKLSYPSANVDDLELFVSSHLFNLFGVIMQINFGGDKTKDVE